MFIEIVTEVIFKYFSVFVIFIKTLLSRFLTEN